MVLSDNDNRNVGDLCSGCFFCDAVAGLRDHLCQPHPSTRSPEGENTHSCFFPIKLADANPHNFISAPVAINTRSECRIARAL